MFLVLFCFCLSEVEVCSILNSVTVIRYPNQKLHRGGRSLLQLTVPN